MYSSYYFFVNFMSAIFKNYFKMSKQIYDIATGFYLIF